MGLKVTTLRTSDKSKMSDVFSSYEAEKEEFIQKNISMFRKIEGDIAKTNNMGKLPLWDEYKKLNNYGRPIGENPKRKMSEVRTKSDICQFYTWLVQKVQPTAVLEFGAAFGASGMHWLAGMELCGKGKLYSFEPNDIWSPIARNNFDTVSDKYVLTPGTFEDNLGKIKSKVKISLIDAIHTRDFVVEQFELVKKVSAKGALVLFDDINFSADMQECWREISANDDFKAVWQLDNRVGVVELP